MSQSPAAATAKGPSWPLSFWNLWLAQAQVPFNDNATKALMLAFAAALFTPDIFKSINSIAGALVALPFVLFSPVCGWLADVQPKSRVLNWALLLQVVAMGLICAALAIQSFPLAAAAFFLISIQTVLFSPAKQGIIKEMVGKERLGTAVGITEAGTTLGILVGAVLGAWLYDVTRGHYGAGLDAEVAKDNIWFAALVVAGVLTAICLVTWLLFLLVPATPRQAKEPFRWSLFYAHFGQLKELFANRTLLWPALGTTYFYTVGAILFLVIPQLCQEIHGGETGTGTLMGVLQLLLALGIVLGYISAAWVNRRGIELGFAPVTALVMPILLLVLGLKVGHLEFETTADFGSVFLAAWSGVNLWFSLSLFLLGWMAAVFLVTCYGYLQYKTPDDCRGRVLGSANILTNLGALGGVGVYSLFAASGMPIMWQMLTLVLLTGTVAFLLWRQMPGAALRVIFRPIVAVLFPFKKSGLDNIPREGGAIIISNHASYLDAVFLGAACPRPAYFIGGTGLLTSPLMRWIFAAFNTIPVSPTRAKEAMKAAIAHLKDGGIIVLFPEGELSRTGAVHEFKEGFVFIAKKAGVPVIPAAVDRVYGSFFSYSEGKIFARKNRHPRGKFAVRFGTPLPPDETLTADAGRQAVMELGAELYAERAEYNFHLGYKCLKALRRDFFKLKIIDHSSGRKEYKGGMTLAVAAALAAKWRKDLPGQRVGMVLPPGFGGYVVNLALVLAGKIPVNLNATAGRATVESCYRQSGIKVVITAAPVMAKLKSRVPDFPWPEDTRDLIKEIESIGKVGVVLKLVQALLIPSALLRRLWGVPKWGGDNEAGLLFSSGSTGEPKGIPLTHRNIMANSAQIYEVDVIPPQFRLLASLPIFHSFGFTVQVWHTLLRPVTSVTVPLPLDPKPIAEAIEKDRAHVLLGTPTFFRPYFRKVQKEQLQSLLYVVGGAEKTPAGFHQQWQETFGSMYLEGYGMTEASPVVAVNVPDPIIPNPKDSQQKGYRIGSVGRLFPGVVGKIIDPDTRQPLPPHQKGILCLKGPNLFKGYLGNEKATKAAFTPDGYYITGDLARFDENAFLYIEGRLSRFSKIAGEMVPHGAVEDALNVAFGWENAEKLVIGVSSAPDAERGEQLVLLTTVDLTVDQVREALTKAGHPNLWVPRKIKRIEAIPVLGSGKFDLKAMQRIAAEG